LGVKLVSDAAEVAGVAEAIRRAPLAAFDLEFASADRLVPALCLIQVAWLEQHTPLDAPAAAIVAEPPQVRLVDPLTVDAGPVIEALATHPLVIAHAPRQDLALLAVRFGTSMVGLVDTQLMAAFCGIGDQVGLAPLASELLGLALAKEQQWTDWEARPLSDAQLTYADADVRHLPALYAKLAARLGPRVAWVREESGRIVADALAAARVTPETAWRNVTGARGHDPATQAAIVELAAWRQRIAMELDRPLGQVLADKLVVELARQRPSSVQAIRQLKGMSPLAKTRAEEIAAALGEARGMATRLSEARTAESGGRTERSGARTTSTRAQRWTEMLLAIVQLIAEETKIAPRLLATRADAEELARIVDEGGIEAAAQLPAFSTWRREVLGTALEGWLLGRIAIVGDPLSPHGFRLLPR
jgi:ribonuclease D